MKTIPTINKIVGDYSPGELVLISGKAGSGMTSYLIFEAVNAALNKNKVLFCTHEMTTQDVVHKMDKCLESLEKKKFGLIYGMGIYKSKKQKDVDIIVRQFDDNNSIGRIKNFINSLSKKNKKPDVVFIDFVVTPSEIKKGVYKSSAECFEESIKNLKELAKETGTVIFLSTRIQRSFRNISLEEYDEKIKNNVDFIFCVENFGRYELSKQHIFEVTILKIREKSKIITLKGSFNFLDLNLKFLEFNYDYDDTLHDISIQFKALSFVLSPDDKHRRLFLLNLAEMYSKAGKNVLYLYPNKEKENDLIEFNGGNFRVDDNDKNLIIFDNNIGKKYFTTKQMSSNGLLIYIEEKFDVIKDLDYIIIDNVDFYEQENIFQYTHFIENLRKFVVSKNTCIIAGSETRKNTESKKIALHDFSHSTTKSFMADFVLGLKNIKPKTFHKIIKMKYNVVLSVLKNRTGNYGQSFFVKIEEDKPGIQTIKKPF